MLGVGKKQKQKIVKKTSKLKKLQLLFKNWQELEKQKKELKFVNRSVKPKGYMARKAGVITFWTLFGFMFLVVMVTLFSNDSDNANADVTIEQNYATKPEAIQFAKNFTEEYFTWTVSEEGVEERKERLGKYFARGLNQVDGLDIKNLNWNSTFKNAELKRVEEKGKNISHITFLVEFEVTKISKKEEVKRLSKYFVVPVAFDGETFGVYELPKFTHIEEHSTLKEVKYPRYEQADVETTERIKEFLPTFFKTYAEDTKDKLNYMLTDFQITEGLNGAFQFQEIQNLEVFKGDGENQYVAFVEVVFVEPETGIPFKANYQLEITRKEDKLLVSGVDSEKNKKAVAGSEPIEVESESTQEATNNN